MRTRLSALLISAACLAAVTPVLTVTNGQPDGNRHPYVGIAIQFIPTMPGFITVCSGSALSSTVFLTAAHCFDPSLPVFVSYKSGPPFSLSMDFTPGEFHPHPDWCFGCGPCLPGSDTRDVAVVVLQAARDPGAFAALPSVGLVDTLPMKTDIELVGYGVQGFQRGGGPPEAIITLTRLFAPSQLVQSNHPHSDEFLKLTANTSKGKGGVCFGDSGGPDILSGTDIVLAVNSSVTNPNCAGVTYSNRIDLPDVLEFITSFVEE
jgi:Trypsin